MKADAGGFYLDKMLQQKHLAGEALRPHYDAWNILKQCRAAQGTTQFSYFSCIVRLVRRTT